MSKKLEEKQARRLAEERRREEERRSARRRNLVTLAVAIVVGALVVGSIVLQRQQEGGGGGPVGVAKADAGCGQIQRPQDQGRDHIQPGAPHDRYSSTPPTSGPHYGTPASAGFYSSALPPEQVVHNLEHGQIVIWYKPDASQETIDDIEQLVQQEPQATVAVPFEDVQGSATFVLSAWGAMQSCVRVSQEVVDDFRRQFQGKSPEPLTPPFEG